MISKLFIFDFDYTIIDENSDTWILEKMAPNLLSDLMLLEKNIGTLQKFIGKNIKWPSLIDYTLYKLQRDGYTLYDIINEFKTIPFPETSVKLLVDLLNNPANQVMILSDANLFYITIILHHHKLLEKFKNSSIVTNTVFIKDGYVRINNEFNTYNYKFSKSNIVKTHIDHVECIYYIGDGINDLPAIQELRQNDYALIRKGYDLDNYLQEKEDELSKIKCKISYWKNHTDLREIINI